MNTVDVLFDLIGSLVPSSPGDRAGSVPEEPIPLGEIVDTRHWNWFTLPKDEGGPIYIYMYELVVIVKGQIKDR